MRSSVIVVAVLVAGCGSPRKRVDHTYICDISDSGPCTAEDLRTAAERFISKVPPPGSRFLITGTGCSVSDTRSMFSIEVPSSWGGGVKAAKRAWQEDQTARLPEIALPERLHCSGIIATIWRYARGLASSSEADHLLTLFTDGREASELWNFEKAIPEPSVFVRQVREHGLLPDLRAVGSVEICGFNLNDNLDGTPWSAQKDIQLRAVWEAYFREAGARRVTFTDSCSSDPAHMAKPLPRPTAKAPKAQKKGHRGVR